jgi:hypothetical protein
MEQLQQHLVSMGTVSLVVMTVAAVFFTRRIVETALPWVKKQETLQKNSLGKAVTKLVQYERPFARWWNEVIVYALPVVFGVLWAFIDNDFLFGGITGFWGRAFFSGALGWSSGFLYKIAKRAIPKMFGVDVELEAPKDGIPEEM